MEILASLIEGGCYSAVFAILLFVSLKSTGKRESCYREVICELAEGLKNMDNIDGKLDRLLVVCSRIEEKSKRKKKEELCACKTQEISVAEA